MTVNIDNLLAEAYRLDQTGGTRQRAVALIREAATSDLVATFLKDRRDYLKKVRDQGRIGDQNRCHVTAVLVDLLDAAFG